MPSMARVLTALPRDNILKFLQAKIKVAENKFSTQVQRTVDRSDF